MAKEDTAEVNDKKYVFEKVLRRGVRHLEKLLKGYRHGLDLKMDISIYTPPTVIQPS